MRPQLLIACDFDGTVTRQDTLVEILNAFGSPAWHDIQKRVVSGELSIREGLEAELKTVQASEGDLREILKNRIDLEPSFLPFYRKMQDRGIPLILLTGGFDLCVETVLRKENLWPMPYLSNRLVRNNGAWHIEFPHPPAGCAACGHCKGDPISQWNAQGYTTLFVGNGVTDRCAATAASVTFAKDELGRWCAANGAPYVPYQTFNDIEKELTR
jgi:2,3-diketo-5-methylthio-1-phosphopentane phosphatase